ncbi:hypothetical protein P7C71_g3048, partial [Lecanoromycetidae sp. Uapishka_2]
MVHPTSARTATKFMIISDTHNFQFEDDIERSCPLQLPTPKVDVLLHCGDLTQVGGVSSFKNALKMLGKIDAELKLVIPGNHDLELDKAFWEIQRDDDGALEDPEDHELAVKAMTGPLATKSGVSFLFEGTHSFVLSNGAKFTIYVSPYTPAFCDWAFAYEHKEDRYNDSNQVADGITSIAVNSIPDDVDIVMTHGPPKGILDQCSEGNVGCENLLHALCRVKPMMHCFGHIHEGNGVEVIDWNKEHLNEKSAETRIENPYPEALRWGRDHNNQTLAVNASIMDGTYKPENAPWLITIDLPCAT